MHATASSGNVVCVPFAGNLAWVRGTQRQSIKTVTQVINHMLHSASFIDDCNTIKPAGPTNLPGINNCLLQQIRVFRWNRDGAKVNQSVAHTGCGCILTQICVHLGSCPDGICKVSMWPMICMQLQAVTWLTCKSLTYHH
jgi:hypothetical protein